MSRAEILNKIEEIIEEEPGVLLGSEELASLSGWDSIAVMSYIAMADEELEIMISGQAITSCKTVDDLVNLCAAGVQN